MADNPASAALEEIGAQLEAAALAFPASGIDPARAATAAGTLHGNALKALAGVEAALKHHQPVQLHGEAEDSKGNATCGHGQDYDGDAHYEGDDGLWYCESLPGPVACSGCPGSPDGEYADWPCAEYNAILAALTGKETPDGR
jgi:hypothetical protein